MARKKVGLFDGMPIIHETVPTDHIFPKNKGRGLDMRDRPREGRAYEGVATAFPKSMLIPRSEWQARIEERKARKITNREVIDAAGLPCKDQKQTNFCWINAPTYAMECTRVLQHQEQVILSPASAGAQIKNYRNVGGWGREGLEWIANKGLVPVEKWPANAIERQYATAENKAIAMNYRADEWMELDISSIDETISCLLQGFVVAVGYNWWSHEITLIDPVWVDGAIGGMGRNSWGMTYGDKGYFVLQGKRLEPDDAVSPRSAVAA